MARQRAQQIDVEDEAPSEPITDTITYVPGQGDPATVKWAGQTFHANVGKELTGRVGHGATEREELNHHIITTARNNHPHFSANGAKKGKSKPQLKTPEDYRRHLAAWLQDPQIESVEQLIGRFASETQLRISCEVGAVDYELIRDVFMPRLGDLQKAMEMTDQQVAQTWLNAGFNQLPWQEQ